MVDLLDDELYALNQRLGEGSFPRRAKDYLDEWANADSGWLRKYYADMDEIQFDALPAVEKADTFVRSLERREFIGTESRLNTAFELLRQIVYGAEDDPAKRLEELHRQRAAIDQEIAKVERDELLHPAASPRGAGADSVDGVDQAAVGIADDQLDRAGPRSRSERRNSLQKSSVSLSPTSMPDTSRCPSAVTPVAITTAWETTRPPIRALQ